MTHLKIPVAIAAALVALSASTNAARADGCGGSYSRSSGYSGGGYYAPRPSYSSYQVRSYCDPAPSYRYYEPVRHYRYYEPAPYYRRGGFGYSFSYNGGHHGHHGRGHR